MESDLSLHHLLPVCLLWIPRIQCFFFCLAYFVEGKLWPLSSPLKSSHPYIQSSLSCVRSEEGVMFFYEISNNEKKKNSRSKSGLDFVKILE